MERREDLRYYFANVLSKYVIHFGKALTDLKSGKRVEGATIKFNCSLRDECAWEENYGAHNPHFWNEAFRDEYSLRTWFGMEPLLILNFSDENIESGRRGLQVQLPFLASMSEFYRQNSTMLERLRAHFGDRFDHEDGKIKGLRKYLNEAFSEGDRLNSADFQHAIWEISQFELNARTNFISQNDYYAFLKGEKYK